jgi:hypothetical protein
MGEEKFIALIQESLNVATRTGAAKPADFSKVIIDTTVQPRAVTFPTDAKLMHRARERLIRLAKKHGVALRQSHERVGKRALIAHQRYAHAKQFKRANRALRTLRTYLGRVTRDIMRKIKGKADLESVFTLPLSFSRRCAISARTNEGRKSIRCTRQRSNASTKATRIALTSSASRFPSPRRRIIPRAASSSLTPRRCRAIPTTATRWRPSFRRSRRRSASISPPSSPIGDTAAIMRRPIIASRSISLPRISGKSKLPEAIRYAHSRRTALELFLADGRVELDSDIVERAIRPQAITRKNALFAGSSGGGRTWAAIATTTLQTCRMNDVDPHAWAKQTLERIANRWPNKDIDALMPRTSSPPE